MNLTIRTDKKLYLALPALSCLTPLLGANKHPRSSITPLAYHMPRKRILLRASLSYHKNVCTVKKKNRGQPPQTVSSTA